MSFLKAFAVSFGEPAGIGPDIALLAYAEKAERCLPPFYIIGDFDCLYARSEALGLSIPLKKISAPREALSLFEEFLPVFDIGPIGPVEAGVISLENETIVSRAIEVGVQHIADGVASGLVTCPIQKQALSEAGFSYPGHTEFLGALAGAYFSGPAYALSKPVMMLASERLRVVPLTVHVPLRDVFGLINDDLICTTVETVVLDLKARFGLDLPRVAITGLNPHAGEGGVMGREEIEIISPAIAKLTEKGFDVRGPLPADTAFHEEARGHYDVVIAMYHDQALIPIKTLDFDTGVNVTLGLPFIRTSPDHGTALSLAGTGRANPLSFISALKMAADMAQNSLLQGSSV